MTFSSMGKKRRLEKLLTDGKLVVVPIDDSFILVHEGGLFRLGDTVSSICAEKPSALMGYRLGLEHIVQNNYDIPFIYNISASTTIGTHTRKFIVQSVENALIAGADAVAVHVNLSSAYENEMLRNFAEVANDCDKMGVPLLAIAYPRSEKKGQDYNYEDVKASNQREYAKLVAHCVRVVSELGADIIKTYYTGSEETFSYVTEAAEGKPIVIAGGSKTSVKESLSCIVGAMKGGGSGISFGRNVFNADHIGPYIRVAKDIVFKGFSLEDAMDIYNREVGNANG